MKAGLRLVQHNKKKEKSNRVGSLESLMDQGGDRSLPNATSLKGLAGGSDRAAAPSKTHNSFRQLLDQ